LEETVMEHVTIIRSIVEEALNSGPETPPAAMIAVINALTEPVKVISDHDASIPIGQEFHEEFGYLVALTSRRQLSHEQISRWAALVRWLLREMHEWSNESDPQRYRFAAILYTAVCCDMDGALWAALPDTFVASADLLAMLEKVIATATLTIGTRHPGLDEPIWERKVVDEFQHAEQVGDWAAIGELWRYIKDSQLPNIVSQAASRCLCRLAPDRLVRAMQDMKQTALAARVLDPLTIEQRLVIGSQSSNPYVQYASALEAFSAWRKDKRPTGEEQRLIEQLLLNVAGDHPRWIQWMRVFNRYPVRYPAIQTPLGRVLASASWAAVEAYLDTIELTVSPAASRVLVAECLDAFRSVGEPERAKKIWRHAYARWDKWQFGVAETERFLYEIVFSELDYAIVGYAVVCLTESERNAAQAKIVRQLQTVTGEWHPSLITCYSAWYELLSAFQPFAHATHVVQSGEPWLQMNREPWPFDRQKEPYVAMMFRTN
jgi:hypothetical protein